MEKLNLVNGNGKEFEIGLPQLCILEGGKWDKPVIDHITENTELAFDQDNYGNIKAQPTRSNQIIRLLLTYNFKTKYVNNATYKNTLFLKSCNEAAFKTDSICFDCCEKNDINTNGLVPGDYLAA